MSSAASSSSSSGGQSISKKKTSVYNVIWAMGLSNEDPFVLIATKNGLATWIQPDEQKGKLIINTPIVNNPGQPVFPGGSAAKDRDKSGRVLTWWTGFEAAKRELREELGLEYAPMSSGPILGDVCRIEVACQLKSVQVDTYKDGFQVCRLEVSDVDTLRALAKRIQENMASEEKAFLTSVKERTGIDLEKTLLSTGFEGLERSGVYRPKIADHEISGVDVVPSSRAYGLFEQHDGQPYQESENYKLARLWHGIEKPAYTKLGWFSDTVNPLKHPVKTDHIHRPNSPSSTPSHVLGQPLRSSHQQGLPILHGLNPSLQGPSDVHHTPSHGNAGLQPLSAAANPTATRSDAEEKKNTHHLEEPGKNH